MNRKQFTLALLSAGIFGPQFATAQATQPLPMVKIYLAGDSTVTPDAGWGDGFAACLTDRAKVTNLSKGGRSSKSFINEGRWQQVLDATPDYVLIQFGHNDQKADPTRGTDPKTTYRQYMTQYVDTARAAGIKPILVTSLSRRQWNKNGDGTIQSTLTPWADVVKEIAREKNVPLLNLHDDSIALYEKLGQKKIENLSATKPASAPSDDPADKGKGTAIDGTHINAKGSAVIGRLVADELVKAVPELAPYVKPD